MDCTKTEDRSGVKFYELSAYIDGKKLFSGGYGAKDWDDYVSNQLNDAKYYLIGKQHGGRSSSSQGFLTVYGGLSSYAVRLYNRGLSDDEILENYNKSVAYRETLNR